MKHKIIDNEHCDELATWELEHIPPIGAWIEHRGRRFRVEELTVCYDDAGKAIECELCVTDGDARTLSGSQLQAIADQCPPVGL